MRITLFCALVLAGCTKPNPAVCCLDTADCNGVGIDEVRNCSAGLACVNHQCEVPSCSTTGCTASAPVCNITTDVCDPCADSGQCSRFTDSPICDATSGSCVGCVAPSDCSGNTPVCDANTCRACRLDSDCTSGACGDTGACIEESAIAYLDAAGVDNGTCTKASPCKTIPFAVAKTSASRNHLVMQKGGYVHEQVQIQPGATTADPLYIHGSGSSLRLPSGGDSAVLSVGVSAVIRDLEFPAEGGRALDVGPGTFLLERLKIYGGFAGIQTAGDVTVRDSMIEDTGTGITISSGQLIVERTTIHGGRSAIVSGNFGTTVKLTNVLVYGTTERALDLQYSDGSIAFSTIADSGMTTGTGPQAVLCSSSMSIKASIIWTSNSTGRAPVDGCGLSATIAGPRTVAGAMNVDPMFTDAANHDYHIKATSPAKDALDAGPAMDFEGDARPSGARFDIGADEAP